MDPYFAICEGCGSQYSTLSGCGKCSTAALRPASAEAERKTFYEPEDSEDQPFKGLASRMMPQVNGPVCDECFLRLQEGDRVEYVDDIPHHRSCSKVPGFDTEKVEWAVRNIPHPVGSRPFYIDIAKTISGVRDASIEEHSTLGVVTLAVTAKPGTDVVELTFRLESVFRKYRPINIDLRFQVVPEED